MDIYGDINLSPTWGLGCGHLQGHYSVSHMGIKTWTLVGTFICPLCGDQDVDVCGDIILSPTQGFRMWTTFGGAGGHHSGHTPTLRELSVSQAGTVQW